MVPFQGNHAGSNPADATKFEGTTMEYIAFIGEFALLIAAMIVVPILSQYDRFRLWAGI